MATNYQNGKIYKITGNGYTYYGSTVRELSHRLSGHLGAYKSYMTWEDQPYITSFKCFENNIIKNYKISLVELCPCSNNNELQIRERYHIELNRENCVNKCIPGRTSKEYKIDNADIIRTNNKQYKLENKEKISSYNLKKDTCICGAKFAHINTSRHKRTKKHITYCWLFGEDQ
jgi:hypothetical protein